MALRAPVNQQSEENPALRAAAKQQQQPSLLNQGSKRR